MSSFLKIYVKRSPVWTQHPYMILVVYEVCVKRRKEEDQKKIERSENRRVTIATFT
jgi:hypothetical protein